MKKILVLVIAVIFSFSAKAVETKMNYYIMNTGETMNCSEISFGMTTIKAVLESGEKVVLHKSDVKAFRVNGKYFEKMNIVKNNKLTDKQEFMEFVATRAGLKLFKYSLPLTDLEGTKAFNSDGYKADCYVIYKGSDFYNQITEKNYPTIFEFFSIKYTDK